MEKGKNNKIELHFHTMESSRCGRVAAQAGVQAYGEAGYAGIVVTDHFSQDHLRKEVSWKETVDHFLEGFRIAEQAGERNGIRVYLGMEIRFPENQNDYLAFGLDKSLLYENPWLTETDIADFYKWSREHGLFIVQAHPYRKGCAPARPEYLDGVEVYNGNVRHDSRNQDALLWAEREGLIQTVGSDFHREEDLSGRGILVEELPMDEKELAAVLRDRKFELSEGEEEVGRI